VVVGSQSSSNSNRLARDRREGRQAGLSRGRTRGPAPEWFAGKQSVGVTAGASAPELLVQRVVARLREWGGQVRRRSRARGERGLRAAAGTAGAAARLIQTRARPVGRTASSGPALPGHSGASRRPRHACDRSSRVRIAGRGGPRTGADRWARTLRSSRWHRPL